jgi:hypothetical protein
MKGVRGILMLSTACGVLLGAETLRAQPMQISPPSVRPPADVPAKKAAPPRVQAKPKAKTEPKAEAKRPALKKSIAEPKAPAPSTPIGFAPENPLVQQPFATPQKQAAPPAASPTRTTSLAPQVPQDTGIDIAYGAYRAIRSP